MWAAGDGLLTSSRGCHGASRVNQWSDGSSASASPAPQLFSIVSFGRVEALPLLSPLPATIMLFKTILGNWFFVVAVRGQQKRSKIIFFLSVGERVSKSQLSFLKFNHVFLLLERSPWDERSFGGGENWWWTRIYFAVVLFSQFVVWMQREVLRASSDK